MDLRNKVIIKSLIGFILGMFIELFFWVRAYGAVYRPTFVLFLIMGGLIGLINNGSSVVYDIESWSTTRATIVHYFTTVIVFLSIAMPLGWFEWDLTLAIFMAIFTLIYVLIWLFNYLYWKKTIREVNEQIETLKRED